MFDKLNVYKTVEVIKVTESKRIELVYNQINHLYYIKRELKQFDYDTYQRLKDNPCDGFIGIIDLFLVEEQLIIIEEFMNAPTLDTVLLNDYLSHEQILQIMDDICDTIHFLHKLNPPVIHRDIKPENIFYYRHHAIIFDFDISREFDSSKTKDTQLMGSVGYAAPEQFGFSQSDSRSDVYALGVLLNVLLTKQFPQDQLYEGEETNVIEKATAIDPKQRYQSVREFKLAMHQNEFLNDEAESTLPGFRKNKLSHKIIAVLYWMSCIGFARQVYLENGTDSQLIAMRIAVTIWTVSIPLLVFNYRGLHRVVLFNDSNNKIKRIAGLVLTIFLFLFIVLLFVGTI